MALLRVSFPREYGKGLHVGQLLRVEQLGETVVLAAADQALRNSEPEIFVGSNWDGLSFEIPPDRVPGFISLLADRLKPARAVLYYSEAGRDRKVEVANGDLSEALTQIGARVLDHAFSAEFGEHTLFSGGAGCFSLQADLPGVALRDIAQSVLDHLGIEYRLDRDDFQVGVTGGAIEVYR